MNELQKNLFLMKYPNAKIEYNSTGRTILVPYFRKVCISMYSATPFNSDSVQIEKKEIPPNTYYSVIYDEDTDTRTIHTF